MMLETILVLLGSAFLIYLSCELFVNAIEWVGKSFGVSQNAVGTVLAAFGTALPESVVTLVAVAFGVSSQQKDIGIGAALGGPLVLSTIAYGIVGIAIFYYCKRRACGTTLSVNSRKLSTDQLWFVLISVFKVALGFLVFTGKGWLGLLFIAAYIIYVWKEIQVTSKGEDEGDLAPLTFRRRDTSPSRTWILLQTGLALAIIFVGSQLFVHRLEELSDKLGVSAQLIALLLSPVATELPEIMNTIIWVRQGKELLALGNISGSMMIQATIPTALGILYTPWLFDQALTLAALITFASIIFLWITLRQEKMSASRLTFASLFYMVFAIGLVLLRD